MITLDIVLLFDRDKIKIEFITRIIFSRFRFQNESKKSPNLDFMIRVIKGICFIANLIISTEKIRAFGDNFNRLYINEGEKLLDEPWDIGERDVKPKITLAD